MGQIQKSRAPSFSEFFACCMPLVICWTHDMYFTTVIVFNCPQGFSHFCGLWRSFLLQQKYGVCPYGHINDIILCVSLAIVLPLCRTGTNKQNKQGHHRLQAICQGHWPHTRKSCLPSF